jgi:hypothetical protein
MVIKQLQRAHHLRQRPVTWFASLRRAYSWIRSQGERAYRPYAFVVAEVEQEKVRRIDIARELPTYEDMLASLLKAMRRPMLGSGGRYRPARVVLDDAALVEVFAPALSKIHVQCEYRPSLSLLDHVLHELAVHMHKQELIPGLLSVPGATVPLIEDLYTAAAAFFRRAPWDWLGNQSPLELRYVPGSHSRYALVLGSGGETLGLSLYDTIEDIRRVYANAGTDDAKSRISWCSLIFEEAMAMSFYDLDAIEKYAWPVASESAYPVVLKIVAGHETYAIPSAVELAWLAAALRVIPDFMMTHLGVMRGPAQPASAIYPLSDVHSGQSMALRHRGDLWDRAWDITWKPSKVWPAEDAQPPYIDEDLERYIEDWYWDKTSHRFAQQLGSFLLEFIDALRASDLSERTVRKHIRNCQLIGKFVCDYGYHERFSPDIFLSEPGYLIEFKHKMSNSPWAVKSYMATWRKINRYVRELSDGV